MSTVAEQLMTVDEFLAKYGHCSGVELVRGRVVWAGQDQHDKPTGGGTVPNFEHGVYCRRAAKLIGDFVDEHGLGWVASNDSFVPVGFDPPTVRGPDVLYVSYAKVPKGKPPADLSVPPELVVEVRSPSDRLSALSAKAAEYTEAGVTVVVVLDPPTESAAVYRVGKFPTVLHKDDELALPDVLPGFSVPVNRFFE